MVLAHQIIRRFIIALLLTIVFIDAGAQNSDDVKIVLLARHEHHDVIYSCDKVEHKMESLDRLVQEAWNNKQTFPYQDCKFFRKLSGLYLAARNKGELLLHRWHMKVENVQSLFDFIQKTKTRLEPDKIKTVTTLELHLTHNENAVDFKNPDKRKSFLANVYRGIRGMEIRREDKIIARYPATTAIIENQRHSALLDNVLKYNGLSRDDIGETVSLKSFNGDQYLFELPASKAGNKIKSHKMLRGNTLIEVEEVTQAKVKRWADLAEQWLTSNIYPNGRMTYQYFPSDRSESSQHQRESNNMIRQWKGSIVLNQVAVRKENSDLVNKAEKNIKYNLSRYYKKEIDFGLIEYDNTIKLGALALAAQAIISHPSRQKWHEQEEALIKTIQSLWNNNGLFNTFYKPKGKMHGQNTYPGQALLLWSQLYRERKDAELLKQIMKSFQYYRNLHMQAGSRKPSFIPWHSQAYFNVWEITKNKELKEFVFEINDWLIDEMQQWRHDIGYEDLFGRFYSPEKKFGRPHAASTGLYMESIVDAYRLARKVGDKKREEKYRIALIRGLRNIIQLQFEDEVDMFYIPEQYRKHVQGGLRASSYINHIRCDNIHYNLSAVYRILDNFKPQDYVHPKEEKKPKINIVPVDPPK